MKWTCVLAAVGLLIGLVDVNRREGTTHPD